MVSCCASPTAAVSRPFSVAFHPDGSRIAVGFDDSTDVRVFDVADLSFAYAADTEGVSNGDLGTSCMVYGWSNAVCGGPLLCVRRVALSCNGMPPGAAQGAICPAG